MTPILNKMDESKYNDSYYLVPKFTELRKEAKFSLSKKGGAEKTIH